MPETSIGPQVAMPPTPARCSLCWEGSVSSLEPSAEEWRQSESDQGREGGAGGGRIAPAACKSSLDQSIASNDIDMTGLQHLPTPHTHT